MFLRDRERRVGKISFFMLKGASGRRGKIERAAKK